MPQFAPPAFSESVLAVVMAGGDGKRLRPLTTERAKPAVPFGAVYRIIDFTLSNCINSGVRKILVLTQYKSDSLNRHLLTGWNFLSPELGEFIWNMPPQKRVGDTWYQGTADSVFQNLFAIRSYDPKWVVILSADHIYKMDYRKMLRFHEQKGADVVIATNPIPKEEAIEFGVVQIDQNYRITDFKEKVKDAPTIPGKPDTCLANMGIYTFPAKLLYDVLEEFPGRQTGNDFGKDILPALVARGAGVYAWPFEDENRKGEGGAPYWRDVGTLDAYFEANMDLVQVEPTFNLYDEAWPLRTTPRQLPPAKFVFAQTDAEGGRRGHALDSVVAPGSIISGGQVLRSMLAYQVRVNSYASVQDSIMLDGSEVGRHARIRNCILDKFVKVPARCEIGYDPEADRKRGFTVTESGLVVIGRKQPVPEPPVQVAT